MATLKFLPNALACILLAGLSLHAHTEDSVYRDMVPVRGRFSHPPKVFSLRKGNYIHRDYLRKDWHSSEYIYGGRTFREMSKSELGKFNAMPRITQIPASGGKHTQLYFDGRKIKTNVRLKEPIREAYFWKGGVLLVCGDSHRMSPFNDSLGFIDLDANRCTISRPGFKAWYESSLSFIVPVEIDESNTELRLEVSVPERLCVSDRFDCVVSLANESNVPVILPETLGEGLAVYRCKTWENSFGTEYSSVEINKIPEPAAAYLNPPTLLLPSETRRSSISLNARQVFFISGRYRVVFTWDGFLDPDDRSKMTRLRCERWVEVVDLD